MAYSGYKGITVKFGADTTELGNALKKIDSQSTETKKNLQAINSALKVDPKNVNLMGQKFNELSKQIETTRKRLETLKDAEAGLKTAMANGMDGAEEQWQKYQYEVTRTQNKLASLQKQASRTTSTLKNELVGGLQGLKNQLGSALKLVGAGETALVGLSAKAVKTGMSFDNAMSQVAATMGKTTDEVSDLREFAEKMGETTAFSASEAAQALNYMALAGYDSAKAMKTLPDVLNLAAAGGLDLATASDMVTDAESALGLTSEQTTHMIDQMATAASKSNTSVGQLGEAILQVGGTAKTLKGGTTELSTDLGILADAGIKSAEGGTKLRNVILSLSAPTSAASKTLKELGVSTKDSEGNFRATNEIFKDLQKSLEGLGTADANAIKNKIFNKQDLAAVNALLANCGQRYDELSAQIDKANGSAKDMANTQLDNLQGDLTLLKSEAEGLQIAISDKLTPSLRELVQDGTEEITKLIEKIKSGGLDKTFEELGRDLSELISTGIHTAAQVLPSIIKFLTAIVGHLKEIIIVVATIKVTSIAATTVKNIVTIVNALKSLKAVLSGIDLASKFAGIGKIAGSLGKFSIGIGAATTALVGLYASYTAVRNVTEEEVWNKLSSDVQEVSKQTDKLVESTKQANDSFDKTLDGITKQANANRTLSDEIYKLSAQENLSADSKDRLNALISQLNKNIPDLNLKYDETTGKLSQQKDATDSLIKSTEEYNKSVAAQELKQDLYKQEIDYTQQLYEAKKELAEQQKKYNDWQNEDMRTWSGGRGDFGHSASLDANMDKLRENIDMLEKAKSEVVAKSKSLDKYIKEVTNDTKKSSKATKEAAKSTKEAAQASSESAKKQEKLSKSIETSKSEMSELASTLDKLNQKQSLSTDQVLNMISKYPQLASAVKSTKDGYIIERQALEQLIVTRAQNLKLLAQEQKEEQISKIKSDANTRYSNALKDALKKYKAAGVVMGPDNLLAKSVLSQYKERALNGTFDESKMLVSNKKMKQASIEYVRTVQRIKRETEASIRTANSNASGMSSIADDIIKNGYKSGSTSSSSSSSSNRTSSSSKSSSKKSSSSDIDKVAQRAQQLLDANEYSYKMGRKSAKAYYAYMEKIDKKYYAGKKKYLEEHRELQLKLHDYRKEQQEQKTQNFEDTVAKEQSGLKTLYDNGKLSAMQYYQALDKLAKRYYKNKAKYLDKYKELENEVQQGIRKAQEDNINNITSLYEKTNDVIEAQHKLDSSNKNQTLKYSTARGLYYDKDISAVNSAKSNLYNAQKSLMQAQLSMGGTLSGAELSKILSNLPSFKNVKLPSTSKVGSKNTIVNTFNFSGDIKANSPKELLEALNKFVAQNKLNKIVGK